MARASPTRPRVSLWLRPISRSSASIWTMRVPGLKVDQGQARAHREHHVRLVHVVAERRVAPVGGAERERVVVAHRALALGGLGHAGLQVLGHRGERVVRAGEMDAAARVDERRARAQQQLGRAVHVARGGRGPGDLGGRQQLGEALVLHRLGRHLELDRARPARPELDGRLAHRGGNVGDLEHALAPLGDRRDAVELVVDLVEQADVLADAVARDLAGEDQHRRGGRVGGGEARHRVEQAGARHDERGAEAAARARVAVGHEAGGLLVARGDEADPRLVAQGRHHPVELHAGQPEDDADAFGVEGAYQRFAARHRCRRHVSSLLWSPPQGACTAPAWARSSIARSL